MDNEKASDNTLKPIPCEQHGLYKKPLFLLLRSLPFSICRATYTCVAGLNLSFWRAVIYDVNESLAAARKEANKPLDEAEKCD